MELATRAYAAFEVKALGDGKRTFSGWATTPAVDRVGDVIDPMGVRFKNPVSLLHQHRHDMPIGSATFGKPTRKGVPFDAEIPEIDEPATLKDRLDVAWGEVKHRLVRAVSVGFRPLKYAFRDDGGVDYQEIEVYELSIVTIPALPEAVITAVKSMAPLSRDMIRDIKRFDRDWSTTGVPLLQVSKSADAPLPLGAVRLVASS